MNQNTPLKWKINFFFFLGGEPFPKPLARWEGVPPPHTPRLTSFLEPPCVPHNSSQINATGNTENTRFRPMFRSDD